MLASIILIITPINSIANVSINSGVFNVNAIMYCNIGRNRAQYVSHQISENEKVLGIK